MPSVEVVSVARLVRADEYWQIVERAYRDVLAGGDPERVHELRRRLADRPQEEQLLFYHEEPLNVALDLVAEDPANPPQPSDHQLEHYRAITRDSGWQINP